MLLFDEQNQQLDIGDIKAELENLDEMSAPSEQELENALGGYYQQALQLEGSKFQFEASFAPGAAAIGIFPIGKKILDAIKKIICGVLNSTSTTDEIIDAVLDALASIIPGGILIKQVAKQLVKYILTKGIGNFCAV